LILHHDPPCINFELPQIQNFDYLDSDPAFNLDADPDLNFHSDADPDPAGSGSASKMMRIRLRNTGCRSLRLIPVIDAVLLMTFCQWLALDAGLLMLC
jgi:hypothetical protein